MSLPPVYTGQPISPDLFIDPGATSASMTETLLTPINELQLLAQTLFQSVSSTQRPVPPPPISAFLAIDATLASAVKQARAHQVKQRKIERLKDEVLELEQRWRAIVQGLEEGRRDLENMLSEADERIKGIEAAKAGAHTDFYHWDMYLKTIAS